MRNFRHIIFFCRLILVLTCCSTLAEPAPTEITLISTPTEAATNTIVATATKETTAAPEAIVTIEATVNDETYKPSLAKMERHNTLGIDPSAEMLA